jgi:hypothetical protein
MEWNQVETNQYGHVLSASKLPEQKKKVLCRMEKRSDSFPSPLVVGYLKYAAGDKNSPEFITPGANGGKVLAWCDCLPVNFVWP